MAFGGGTTTVPGTADDESRAIFDVFAQAGGTFIDTASSYSLGQSEDLLGDFIAADRDHFVVGTKYSNSHGGGLSKSGNSRKNMMRSVEESLRRLRTDYIDVLWLHNWDHGTPVDEVVRGFNDLVATGKVLYVAVSNMPAWEIARANTMADLLGLNPVIAVEIELSLLRRTPENDHLPMARALDLGVVAWAPLASGLLARAGTGADGKRRPRARTPEEQRVIDAVAAVAEECGATPAQVALAALRRLPGYYSGVIPIIGASRPDQLTDSLVFLEVDLTDEQVARLDAASRPTLIYPHSVIRNDIGERLTTGGQTGVLTNHRA
jgi:aryl-alcohol dehydrogenase-like predicted oxidoreductase